MNQDDLEVSSMMTDLVKEFVVRHELFLSLMAGGFTEDQAIKYLAYMDAARMNENGTE